MGEYAVRKSDNKEIKIGTCEEMYYLRFEDRGKVRNLDGNVDPVRDAHEFRFRLPFPDEDSILPGEYEDYNRGLRLYRKNAAPDYYARNREPVYGHSDFAPELNEADPGIIQLRHEASGLLVNVTCYHGLKLPEASGDFKAFWNGKGHSFELASLRPVKGEDGQLRVYPVVRCRHCDHQWRFDWSDVSDFIEPAMRERLEKYMEAVSC